jgi:hypothetical protein
MKINGNSFYLGDEATNKSNLKGKGDVLMCVKMMVNYYYYYYYYYSI